VHNIVVQKEKYLKKGKNAIPLQNEGIFFFGGGDVGLNLDTNHESTFETWIQIQIWS
jgi:hypothetical protein